MWSFFTEEFIVDEDVLCDRCICDHHDTEGKGVVLMG